MKTYTIKAEGTEEGLRLNGHLCKIKHGSRVVSIENRSVGIGHSAHPNIDASGSVKGMKNMGYWGKDDEVVRFGGHYYNMSRIAISDELDALALYLEMGNSFIPPRIGTEAEIKFSV